MCKKTSIHLDVLPVVSSKGESDENKSQSLKVYGKFHLFPFFGSTC